MKPEGSPLSCSTRAAAALWRCTKAAWWLWVLSGPVGASVMGAFYWDNVDNGTSENPYGFTVQGGLFVSDDVELVARYEFGDADSAALDNEFSTATIGANWYLAQNTAKFGANFGYAFDGIGNTWGFAASGNNWLQDTAGEDGQWMVQAQLSFSF